jgi:hypothetical protein
VADYLRIAPCHHIECTINQAQSDPDKLDLTLDTYMHRLWNVHGGAGNAKDYYLIGMPSAGSAHLYQKENPALFAKLFELIGPLAGQQNKKIAPLPAQLMDSIEFPAH